MTKEEKLKEQIEKYENDKKEWNIKIREAKAELRWLKLKRLTQRKSRMNIHRGIKGLRWE